MTVVGTELKIGDMKTAAAPPPSLIALTSIFSNNGFSPIAQNRCSLTCVHLILYTLFLISFPRCSDLDSANGIISNLLYLSPQRNLLYATDLPSTISRPSGKHEHLVCFLAGLFALGTATIPSSLMDDRTRERHQWAAQGLAHTCWIAYADSKTGLGPECVAFGIWGTAGGGRRWIEAVEEWEGDRDAMKARATLDGKLFNEETWSAPPGVKDAAPVRQDESTEYFVRDGRYMLRPEVRVHLFRLLGRWTNLVQTIESFYILWRTTGDAVWRERGWTLFEAIEKHARVDRGYASVSDIGNGESSHMDEMPRCVSVVVFCP